MDKLEDYKTATAELVDIAVGYGLNLASAIVILVVGYLLAGWLGRAIGDRLEKVRRFDKTLIPVLSQIARYGVLLFTLILVLAEFGVQTTSIIAVLGAAGLAIGLALQGTLQNVAAGMMMLILRPFEVGDYVETGACSGTVDEIGLFMTRMRSPQGVFISCPNGKIWSDSIVNYSRLPTRRLDLPVGISYDDDIDKAREVILRLAKKDKRVLADPEPMVFVNQLGESAVDLQLRAWIRREDYWEACWGLTREVKYALDKAGITIPYPHRQIITTAQAPTPGRRSGTPAVKAARRTAAR